MGDLVRGVWDTRPEQPSVQQLSIPLNTNGNLTPQFKQESKEK